MHAELSSYSNRSTLHPRLPGSNMTSYRLLKPWSIDDLILIKTMALSFDLLVAFLMVPFVFGCEGSSNNCRYSSFVLYMNDRNN